MLQGFAVAHAERGRVSRQNAAPVGITTAKQKCGAEEASVACRRGARAGEERLCVRGATRAMWAASVLGEQDDARHDRSKLRKLNYVLPAR